MSSAVEARLEEPVAIVPRRLRLGLLGLAVGLAAALTWGFAGSVPRSMTLDGLILHGQGLELARSAGAGTVVRIDVAPGLHVTAGQRVAAVLPAVLPATNRASATRAATSAVVAPVTGVVVATSAAPGSRIAAGAPVVAIDPTGRDAGAELFVTSRSDVTRLAVGRPVVLECDGTPLLGRISSVAAYPQSGARLAADLVAPVPGLPPAVAPVWLVRVTLDAGSRAAAASAPALTPIRAGVRLPAVRPYRVVFGGR